MRPNIPQSALPTQMDPENRVTVVYTTQVLMPKLGPVGTQRFVRQYARVLRDYAAAVTLVEAARAFTKRFGVPIEIPTAPHRATGRDPRFSPVLSAGNAYLSSHAVALASFAGAKASVAALSSLSGPVVDEPTALKAYTRAAMQSVMRASIAAPALGSGLTYQASAVLPPSTASLLTNEPAADVDQSGRLLLQELSPNLLIGAGKAVRDFAATAGVSGQLSAEMVRSSMEASARGFALAQLLHGLAQPNVVIAELLRVQLVQPTGSWLSARLLNSEDPLALITKALAGQRERNSSRREALGQLMDRSQAFLKQLGMPDGTLMLRLRADEEVRAQVYDFLGRLVDGIGIDGSMVPMAEDTVVTGSREWAFKRSERLNLKVGTPTLRGPFRAEAVSPNSELNISEASLSETVRFTETGTGRSQSRTSESSNFSASTFRQSLSTLSEEGINNEGAFSSNSTLFDTLRERRREAIERTLVQVSSSNEQRSGSQERTVTSLSRSYTTRGKDASFATTELSFQVAAPVEAEVLLESVGLVWCPRMDSPFIYLHQLIVNYERQAEFEYLEQNISLDPVRPVEVYEQSTFTHEMAIKGDTGYQAKEYSFTIPAGQIGWDLDRTATDVYFRNGTAGDYNWDERLNWDDLENWHAWLLSVSVQGGQVMGVAVLETTDPEWLNKGFLTFKIVMRRLTEETRVALDNYDREKQEAAAQRRAVIVRARQYARLRRDELIEQYESNTALREEAFSRLTQQVFQGSAPEHASYYREILHSCIEWGEAKMRFEPGALTSLPFPHLPPSHFMNAVGVRFTLPVLASAEESFFDALETGAGSYHRDAAKAVRQTVDNYRTEVERLKREDPGGLVLDRYSSQLVLGSHLEAVLSHHPFAEPLA